LHIFNSLSKKKPHVQLFWKSTGTWYFFYNIKFVYVKVNIYTFFSAVTIPNTSVPAESPAPPVLGSSPAAFAHASEVRASAPSAVANISLQASAGRHLIEHGIAFLVELAEKTPFYFSSIFLQRFR
jgi:hypothetical protein